jgi:hypothetical protein
MDVTQMQKDRLRKRHDYAYTCIHSLQHTDTRMHAHTHTYSIWHGYKCHMNRLMYDFVNSERVLYTFIYMCIFYFNFTFFWCLSFKYNQTSIHLHILLGIFIPASDKFTLILFVFKFYKINWKNKNVIS